ncbi:MAG: O-antigen polysaccharide polymerase Wzy [Devosia sp.]
MASDGCRRCGRDHFEPGPSFVLESGAAQGQPHQGSILFVGTYVLEHIGKSEAYLNGLSYVHAIVSTITLGAVSLSETLARWLVVSYAGPNFRGGYGFSLDAEAYMNFGILGVFMVGMALSVALSLGARAFGTGSVIADFVVVWSMLFVVYGLRNESFNLVRSIFYCLVTFLGVWLFAYAIGRWRVFRSS